MNDRETYITAWQQHLKELQTLALQAGIQYNEYATIYATLNEWLDKAITNIDNQVNHE